MNRPANRPKTSAERMREHRQRMREKGFVQKTIWVPDMNDPEILADYQRQAIELGKSDRAGDEVMPWIEASMDWPSEEWPEYAEKDK